MIKTMMISNNSFFCAFVFVQLLKVASDEIIFVISLLNTLKSEMRSSGEIVVTLHEALICIPL